MTDFSPEAPSDPIAVDPNLDPGGLIRESYHIEGLSLVEARSIFLDWAIKLDPKLDPAIAIRRLLAVYAGRGMADHPMTQVLTDGLGKLQGPQGRRGGSRARRGV
ncbi:hypothetical protein [Celeribacter sp.]|uniref:hypothetical protein n=1 Tax=Celeribacter sp. TaxID=1890673 RepID=UPI003A8E18DC